MNNEQRITKIPVKILAPIGQRITNELKQTVENWPTYFFEVVKHELGPQWSHIPIDDIRRQLGNARRSGRIGPVGGGHGPSINEGPPEEYKAYLVSDWWKYFSETVREFWGYRCAICNAKATGTTRLDVHHRTYERIGHERITDCIAVCRRCHKMCDIRRKRQEKLPGESDLFEDTA